MKKLRKFLNLLFKKSSGIMLGESTEPIRPNNTDLLYSYGVELDKLNAYDNHQNEKKFTKRALTYDSESLSNITFKPSYDVKFTGDIRGWYSKLTLTPNKNSGFTIKDGKPKVTLEYFNGEMVVTTNYNDGVRVFEMPLHILADISTAVLAMDKLKDNRMLSKTKMKIQEKSNARKR